MKLQRTPTIVFTKLSLSLLLFGFAVALLMNSLLGSSIAQSNREREVEAKIPKEVPIRVKLKSDKEKAFKDRNNAQWYRDFELEVTNTSDKPIYFLEFWLMLPDIKSENDNPFAFSLRYGRDDFIRYETRAVDTDVPIQPGEKHIFTIAEGKQQGWREFKSIRNLPDPGKVRIKLVQVSFGDGTGFNSAGESYPFKRQQSSNGSCPGPPADKAVRKSARSLFPDLQGHSFFFGSCVIYPT